MSAFAGYTHSEPVNLDTFERFRAIAKAAADEARKCFNLSLRVSWFIGFVHTMVPENVSRGDLELFFGIFPNFKFYDRHEEIKSLIASIHNRIELVVSSWAFNSPTLRELIRAYETTPTALPRLYTFESTFGPGPARPSIVYEYKFPRLSHNISMLDEYIKVGQQIKSGPGYKKSAIWNLEKFLCRGRPEVEKYLGYFLFLNSHDRLTKALYAIAAPSYEGKIQSAFVFRDVKPLYFVMSTDVNEVQPIYKNFLRLSCQLLDFGQMDMEHIRQVNFSNNLGRYLDITDITVNSLYCYHRRKRFYVLGLIKALILDARSNYPGTNNTTWMKYYVSTDRRLEVIPISISEFCRLGEDNIKEFCLFLDEFTGERANLVNVLIRNLARTANFKVVVASSNVKVTNCANPYQRMQRGRREVFSRAIIFTKLNPFNSGSITDFDDLKNELYAKVKARERSDLDAFFENFENVQFKKLRPGFVHLIVGVMKRFSQSFVRRRFSLNEFISHVARDLGFELKKRKPNLTGSDSGLIGTKALYFSNAFGSNLDKDVDLMSHCKQYLNFHYYNLINPFDPSKFCFLTYPPGTFSTWSRGTDNTEGGPFLDLYMGIHSNVVRSNSMTVWKPELTIFKENETLPFLSLLGVWHDESISEILSRVNLSSQIRNVDVPNTIQAVVRSGNALEVLSAVCSINASHRDLNSEEMTFTGQGCKSYLSNLIKNLISANNCRIRSDYKVVIPTNRVAPIFDRIHVPFLFPSNISIPEDFWSRFTDADQFRTRSIHLGTFTRTVNQDRIDSKFDLFLKDSSGTGYSKGICTIECKDSERDIEFARLKDIFGKAQNNGASLSFLICNKIIESSEPRHFSELKAECIARKWEIFKVVQRTPKEPNEKVFAIERFHPEIRLPSPNECTMACVILELDVINA